MNRLRRAGAFLLVAATALPARAEEILVFAAASLTESLQEVGTAFREKTGTIVRYSFGASSDLARQIQAGAPADVFFSADTAKMDDLEKARLVRKEDRREFLSNVLVVVVAASSRLRITQTKDLTGVAHLALADPTAVPAGVYAKKWLESQGVWAAIAPKVVPTLDVRAALAAVESGAVEAGIVYRTDAAISKRVRIALVVADGPEITYSLALTKGSRSPGARAFVELASGEVGRAIFERHGFRIRR